MRTTYILSTLLAVTAAIPGCDPADPADGRDLILPVDEQWTDTGGEPGSDSGGGDSGGDDSGGTGAGTEGADEASAVAEQPVVDICLDELDADAISLLQLDATDQFTARPGEPLAAAVGCGIVATGTAKYSGWECHEYANKTKWSLDCQYVCECEDEYESPCNPPHADCGAKVTNSHALEFSIGYSDLGEWHCNYMAPVQCRWNIDEAASKCAKGCLAKAPARTRDCPDCKK